jgi:hypothetical protein
MLFSQGATLFGHWIEHHPQAVEQRRIAKCRSSQGITSKGEPKILVDYAEKWRATVDDDGHYSFAVAL